jgi:hypothetical protein
MSNGFFSLYRTLFEDPLWLKGTPIQKLVMIVCLGRSNHEPKEWIWKGEKYRLERGQLITSLHKLKETIGKGASLQKVRTALKNLEKYEFLTNEATKEGRLITIVNFGVYQLASKKSNIESNKDLTKKQQRGNKEVTPTKEDNKDKEEKKIIYKDILQFWNERKIIVHKKLDDKSQGKINSLLEDGYTVKDIKTAIHNYSVILYEPQYYFKYRWTIYEFLHRGFEKFKEYQVAHENYIREDRNNGKAAG